MRRSISIRAKLTLWYFAATFVGLCIFGLASFGALRETLIHLKRASLIRREQRLLLFLQQNRKANESLDEQLDNYAVITHEGNLFQIRDLNGALLFPTNPRSPSWLSKPQVECNQPVFNDIEINAKPTSVMCHEATINGRQIRLYIGGSLEDNTYVLSTYRNTLLLLLPCLMVIAAIIGYFLSRRALDPVARMNSAALEIGIGNLSARLPEPAAHDKLWSLAVSWNGLLDRLEAAVSRLTKLSADASHDLRTSITVMLATAELALHRRRSEQEYQESLRRIVNECRTASTQLDALLSLARSDNFVHEVAIKHVTRPAATVILISLFTLGVLATQPTSALSQQAATSSAPVPKPVIEEWVYRARYGYKDEWWTIFKKYQIAILERQKELGYVKDFTVYAPSLHAGEDYRWDYRVIIVRASVDAPPGQSEGEVAKQLFSDQAKFKSEENRRWELTTNHWDLPIHVVDLDASN